MWSIVADVAAGDTLPIKYCAVILLAEKLPLASLCTTVLLTADEVTDMLLSKLALDALPLNVAAIVPAEKFPLASLCTIVLGILDAVLISFGSKYTSEGNFMPINTFHLYSMTYDTRIL